MKLFLIQIEERNGEYEYSHDVLMRSNSLKQVEKRSRQILKHWYPYSENAKRDGIGYYFNDMCVFVCVQNIREVTETEFIKRYLEKNLVIVPN